MFKFPLRRQQNSNGGSSSQRSTKSASSRSNDGFIFIRCGHNHPGHSNAIAAGVNSDSGRGHIANANRRNSNNSSGSSSTAITSNSNNNSSNSNGNGNASSRSRSRAANSNNNDNVAKSTVQSSWRPQLPLPTEIPLSNEQDNIQGHKLHHLHTQQREQQQQPQTLTQPLTQPPSDAPAHPLRPRDDFPYPHPANEDIEEIRILESDMERFHISKKDSHSANASQLSQGSNSKKWSFGRFFRRGKKEAGSESSSEEDRKAGFSPGQKYARPAASTSTPNKKAKSRSSGASRGSQKSNNPGGFDSVLVSPNSCNSSSTVTSPVEQHQSHQHRHHHHHHADNEFFLPVETVSSLGSPEPFYQNQQPPSRPAAPQQRMHHSQQYLSHVPQKQQQLLSRSAHSLDRRSSRSKQRPAPSAKMGNSAQPPQRPGSSSEEELISLNSSTFSKYRSDESIHSGGQGQNNGQSRRSRAARNERYYKRLSRDGEVSHGQAPLVVAPPPPPPATQRWKTQPVPLSVFQAPSARQSSAQQQAQPQVRPEGTQYSKLRNTSSLQHMAPYVQWGQQRQQPRNLQHSVNDAKRSISYDSHIHLQNVGGRMQTKPMPPPPPPRDPLRRVNPLQDGSSADLRPLSYAFDQTGVPVLPSSGLHGRCVSDDKIWAQQQPQYQSIHSLNITSTPSQGHSQPGPPQHRRFITRADRDAHPGKQSLPNGLDFHYVADATPRSRKPIHMLDQMAATFSDAIEDPPSSGVLRTTKSGLPISPTKVNANEFWKRMDGSAAQAKATPVPAPRGRDMARQPLADASGKPRSISSSRVAELRAYPTPMYSEVYKPKARTGAAQQRGCSPHPERGRDEADGIVCGSLRIKAPQDGAADFVELRTKEPNKSHSMPDHYQRRSAEMPTTPNKYEEYVNERREQHHNAPQPPQRKLSGVFHMPQLSFPRKKPANLEEAINELEAIYRSLGLTEPEPEPETAAPDEAMRTPRMRVPTPNDFEKFALAHADEYDDEDSPGGEPDPIRDDVAYRNIKLANLQHKTAEKQPPFGIPIGPIVPAPQTDYLHLAHKQQGSDTHVADKEQAPDVIKDDLAVRALRKDPLQPKDRIQYPASSGPKKNRATRTQSANIYALIQRDAAKPSGGDLLSYLELTRSIDRSGSMSDIHKGETASDIPSTLRLLQSLKEQEKEQSGSSPARAKQSPHIPFRHPSQGGAICQLPEKLAICEDAPPKPKPLPRKSLTPEPQHCETHKMEEALNKIAQDAQESSIKLSRELKELRKEALVVQPKPKRMTAQEEKIEKELKEIEKVSQAAKQCGRMLLDTLPDSHDGAEDSGKKASRKLHKEDKLIKAIDQVSEAANKVCEQILKDIVTTEPPVVVQEALRVQQTPQTPQPTPAEARRDPTLGLVMPTLIRKLDPIQSDNIEAIARRCMRQLSDLADSHDYDNLHQPSELSEPSPMAAASTCNVAEPSKPVAPNDMSTSRLTETPRAQVASERRQVIDDIDQIMRECEDQARQQAPSAPQDKKAGPGATGAKAPAGSSATASSFSSSSDCLAKSSSPSASRRFSSSITSFNPYSSSDYIKSPSSEFHAPSTDRLKSCSTTSYDVQSTTSATPNVTTTTNTTNSNVSCSPSPPPPPPPPALNLTPVSNCSATLTCSQRARSSSPSQYNSSEELAMIFGIEEKSAQALRGQKLQKHSAKFVV